MHHAQADFKVLKLALIKPAQGLIQVQIELLEGLLGLFQASLRIVVGLGGLLDFEVALQNIPKALHVDAMQDF